MVSRAMVLLLLQTALLIALALVGSMEGVRGEEEALGEAFVTPAAHDRSLFLKRRLTQLGLGDVGHGISCSLNKAMCTKSPYPTGSICCGDSCTSIQTDYSNYGACGQKCGNLQTCCNGKPVYLATDNNNCGQCGVRCPQNGCKFGVCHYNGGSW